MAVGSAQTGHGLSLPEGYLLGEALGLAEAPMLLGSMSNARIAPSASAAALAFRLSWAC
jgi:hypothetical protein